MQNQNRPNIAELTSRLAKDNSRVNKYIDGLIYRVDEVIEAVSAKNWTEVIRMSQYIARSSSTYGYPIISEAAERLSEAAQNPENEMDLKRKALKLIGACGRVRRPIEELPSS